MKKMNVEDYLKALEWIDYQIDKIKESSENEEKHVLEDRLFTNFLKFMKKEVKDERMEKLISRVLSVREIPYTRYYA